MIETVLYSGNFEFFFQILLAALLGLLLGVERELARKTAGMRTYALVALGSALFSIISVHGFETASASGAINFDPTRIAAQIVTGVGFIGAGLIIFSDNGKSKLQGVTTAAGLWVAAAVGMAVGFRLYFIATFATLVSIFIFTFLWRVEERIVKKYSSRPEYAEDDEK